MEDSEKNDFNLLREEAVNADDFESKTHYNIAKTLCDFIGSNNEGVTIGLEGKWGSGKSTVISILKKELEDSNKGNDSNFITFYFDAWSHQGDPLRRIFLESLINQINIQIRDKNLKKNLEEKKEKISGRKKVINIRTKRSATLLGKLIGIATFFVPLGIAMLTGRNFIRTMYICFEKMIDNHLSDSLGISYVIASWIIRTSSFYSQVMPVLFSAAPLLVILIYFTYLFMNKKNVFEAKNWAFLQSETNEDVTQEVSDEPERSSVEFEKFFKEIINELFIKEEKAKLIIIIDNLDRIDPDDALKIWSTLQLYIQNRNPIASNNENFKKIWTIVPYDENGLSKLWDNLKTTKNENDSEKGDSKGDENGNRNTCSKAFFDKCFQLRIEVPQINFSNWVEFAQKKAREALGNIWANEKIEQIIEVLKHTRKDLTDVPSPREIKTFINQTGFLEMYADTTIDERIIAYYVVEKYINKVNTEEIIKKLLDGDFPKIEYCNFILPDIEKCQEGIAGIICGVSPKDGIQIILEPKIESSLKDVDIEKLKGYENSFPESFWAVFDHHIEGNINNISSINIILNYSFTFHKALWVEYKEKCENELIKKSINKFINNLKLAITKDEILKTIDFPSNQDETDKYSALISLISDFNDEYKETIELIINKLIESLFSKIGSDPKECEKLQEFLSFILEKIKVKYSIKPKKPEWDGKIWMNWAECTLENEFDFYKFIIPEEEPIDKLIEFIETKKTLNSGVLKFINYIIESDLIKERKRQIKDAIKQYDVNLIAVIRNENLYKEFFEVLMRLALKGVGNFNDFQKYYFLLINKVDIDTIRTAAISAGDGLFEQFPEIENFWLKSNLYNAKFVYKQAKRYDTYDFIWALVGKRDYALVADIIGIAIKNNNKDFFGITTENAINRYFDSYNLLKNKNGDCLEKLAEIFLASAEFNNAISSTDFDIASHAEELIKITEKIQGDLQTDKNKNYKKIINGIIIKLEALTQDDWEKALMKNTALLALALNIKDIDENFVLKNGFYDAMIEFSESWAKDKKKDVIFDLKLWNGFINLLNKDFKNRFMDKIENLIIYNKFNINIEFFNANKDCFNKERLIDKIEKKAESYFKDAIENSLKKEKEFDFCSLEVSNEILLWDEKRKLQSSVEEMAGVIKAPIIKLYNEILEEKDSDEKNKKIGILKSIAKRFEINLSESTDDKTEEGEEKNNTNKTL
jgi:hypothetical protein